MCKNTCAFYVFRKNECWKMLAFESRFCKMENLERKETYFLTTEFVLKNFVFY